MNYKIELSILSVALLSMFSSVAIAGQSLGGGCGVTPTPTNPNPCGTLTIKNSKSGTATGFYTNIVSKGANKNSPSMASMFNQAPFNDTTTTTTTTKVHGKNVTTTNVTTTNKFNFNTGTLEVSSLGKTTGSSIVTFTFLGASAANTDLFTVTGGAGQVVSGSNQFNNQKTSFGSTFTEKVTTIGALGLGFQFSDGSSLAKNGSQSIGILDQSGGYTINGVKYADLLLYNDSGSPDTDFNDMVIGVNLNCPTPPVSAVPEPSTYAMLLAGLGLLGFITYRRKNGSSNMMMHNKGISHRAQHRHTLSIHGHPLLPSV